MLFNPWPEILRPARLERGLTQDNAADRAGVSEVTWNRWENGKIHPGPQVFAKLARGVGLSEAELGFRYAQALMYHYEDRLAEAREPDGRSGDVPRAGDPLPPAPSDSRQAPRPALIRGFSSDRGALWIDVNGLIDALSVHRPIGTADPQPYDRTPPARRRKSRSGT